MRIGVISDTHIPANCSQMPRELINVLKGCDLILHAGDLTKMDVLDCLKKISSVEAVWGNMDSAEVRSALPDKKTLELAGKKICLMHGYGGPDDLVEILKKEFLAQKPDIIVFGHSHMPFNKYIDGVLFFNPGSATDTIIASYRSYGIIEITNGRINSEIYKLKNEGENREK